MARRTLDRATTYREVAAHFDHHASLQATRQSGSHRVYTGPTGVVIVPCHSGDVPRGTLRSIMRMALLAGLACLIVAVVVIGTVA